MHQRKLPLAIFLCAAFIPVALTLSACGPETLAVGFEPTLLAEHDSPVQSVAFSPDGALLATGSDDGTLRVWRRGPHRFSRWTRLHALRVSTGEREAAYSHDVAFSPDGSTLAFGLPDGTVRLWRLSENGEELEAVPQHTLRPQAGRICSLAFSPNGGTLATGSWDGSAYIWGIVDGTLMRSLNAHANATTSVAFSPDGMTLVTASLDSVTKVWDTTTMSLVHQLDEHPEDLVGGM